MPSAKQGQAPGKRQGLRPRKGKGGGGGGGGGGSSGNAKAGEENAKIDATTSKQSPRPASAQAAQEQKPDGHGDIREPMGRLTINPVKKPAQAPAPVEKGNAYFIYTCTYMLSA